MHIMPITLNHTIVPAHDKESSARFFARIMGFAYSGLDGHFAPVKVNDTLTLDWDNRDRFEGHHYAFLVNDQEFDDIFGRLKAEGVVYGSGPNAPANGQINTRLGGRGLYFVDPDGHLMEIMTRA
jgi:catechol 2,3-dioxygenase-like lactoylglutathione lyase family enzyme